MRRPPQSSAAISDKAPEKWPPYPTSICPNRPANQERASAPAPCKSAARAQNQVPFFQSTRLYRGLCQESNYPPPCPPRSRQSKALRTKIRRQEFPVVCPQL